MRNTKLITMIEGAIIAGVCVALSYIPFQTANAAFDVSLGLIPLGVYALRRGILPGMTVGFVWGLLLIVLGKAFILTIPQVFLEYPIAFAFGGFGGIFAGRFRRCNEVREEICVKCEHRVLNTIQTIVLSGITAAVTRWFFHFWAGVIFWGSYAPEGMSPYVYSFICNGSSAAVNAGILVAVLLILVKTARTLFIVK